MITKYIQFDEPTKEKPLGIPKTGQILSTKACRIPIKRLSISKSNIVSCNKKSTKKEVFKLKIIDLE